MTTLSAAELGRRAGLSRGAVALIESGARRNPESGTIAALAGFLGIDAGWLLTGSGPEPVRGDVRAAVGDLADAATDEVTPPAGPAAKRSSRPAAASGAESTVAMPPQAAVPDLAEEPATEEDLAAPEVDVPSNLRNERSDTFDEGRGETLEPTPKSLTVLDRVIDESESQVPPRRRNDTPAGAR
jgi:transcriptional regulator with XRE-family HTH domain